jgi:hypothetical protein
LLLDYDLIVRGFIPQQWACAAFFLASRFPTKFGFGRSTSSAE